MAKVEIFEVALCCSTGVCGPAVNEDLLRITTAVNQINANGGQVVRYNLNSNPEMYVKNTAVNELLQKDGEGVLPITILDGKVVKTKAYPTNEELSTWSGVKLGKVIQKKKQCCSGKGCKC